MGSGSSAQKKADNAMTKMAVVNAFDTSNKSSQQPTQPKTNVYDFVKQRKEERALAEQDLKDEKAEKKGQSSNKVSDTIVNDEEEIDNRCALCRNATMLDVDSYACRVCGKMYHKKCLQTSGKYSKEELKFVERAKTNVGWSCTECDNICSLLTTEELNSISDKFEEFDINRDATVGEEEYLQYKKKEYLELVGDPMSESDIKFESLQFKQLDADGSGSLDYWEFMKHEATKKLARRSKEELVKLLTSKEVRACRRLYNIFDLDGDGMIDFLEAKKAYRSWYSSINNAQNDKNSKKTEKETALHISPNTEIIMDADVNDDASVSWDEFLQLQALYIISSRPNKTNVPNA